MQVEWERLELVEGSVRCIEEAGAAGSPEELAAGGGDEVGAYGRHVEGQLARGLAGIDEVPDVGVPEGCADAGDVVHQAVLGGAVGDRDDRDVVVEHRAEGVHVDAAVGVVRDELDLRTGAVGHLQQGQDVGGVLGGRHEDAVTGVEGPGVHDGQEGPVPSGRGGLHEGDLVRSCAEEGGGGVADGLDPVACLGMGLVPADLLLPAEVVDHGLGHDGRGQGRARVVQVGHPGAARGLGPQAVHIQGGVSGGHPCIQAGPVPSRSRT